MAVLTVTDERFQAVEETAIKESKTREEIVDEAIDLYMRRKAWVRIREFGRDLEASGVTEADVQRALREVQDESSN